MGLGGRDLPGMLERRPRSSAVPNPGWSPWSKIQSDKVSGSKGAAGVHHNYPFQQFRDFTVREDRSSGEKNLEPRMNTDQSALYGTRRAPT
jgi:hypothetical protein